MSRASVDELLEIQRKDLVFTRTGSDDFLATSAKKINEIKTAAAMVISVSFVQR